MKDVLYFMSISSPIAAFLVSICIFVVISVSECKKKEQDFDGLLQRLPTPVVVVSTGKSGGECFVKVIDGSGCFHTINDNSMCDVKRGWIIKRYDEETYKIRRELLKARRKRRGVK